MTAKYNESTKFDTRKIEFKERITIFLRFIRGNICMRIFKKNSFKNTKADTEKLELENRTLDRVKRLSHPHKLKVFLHLRIFYPALSEQCCLLVLQNIIFNLWLIHIYQFINIASNEKVNEYTITLRIYLS